MNNRELSYVLGGLLAVSVIANLYLWNNHQKGSAATVPTSTATSSSVVINSPYGYRSEVVTVYDNGQVKTYATTTPVTQKDAEQMQRQATQQMRAMDDYFRQQEQLFQHFWANF